MSVLMNGTSLATSSGVSSSASMPQAFADVMRRRNSSSRSGLRAISMPPQVTLTPIASYWRWLSSVSAAISRLWSTGKMKFDACPVEPPGLGSGPLSICTMSRQPSSARWPTTEFPTMPDPITTTFAVVGRSLTLVLLEVVAAANLATRSSASDRAERCGAASTTCAVIASASASPGKR